jgi:hypothetical protein
MPEGQSEKLHISKLPEGQKKILDLCGNINLWYLKIRKNKVSSASSQKVLDLLGEAQNLYEKTDPITNFDTHDEANVELGIKRGELEKKYWQTKMWLSEREKRERDNIIIDSDTFEPKNLSENVSRFLKKGGARTISFEKKWLPEGGEAGVYGDFVRVAAEKDLEGEITVRYSESWAYNIFKNSHISLLQEEGKTNLAPVRNLFGKNVRKYKYIGDRNNYYASNEYLDNIRFTSRAHDVGGAELQMHINCKTPEEAQIVTIFLLQMIKDSPREKSKRSS